MSANTDLIRSFYDKFMAGDIDSVLSILDDDIVVHECDHVPYPGDHRGKDGFIRLAEAFTACWEFRSEPGVEILPAGEDRVLVMFRADVVSVQTGKPLEMRIAELSTIKDGKLADIVVHYWDTAAMVEATDGVVVLQGDAA